jgi:tripartite-type tricarboxylate transporter receptor subunit TctC
MKKVLFSVAVSLSLSLLAALPAAFAQAFPNRPITLIVGYPAGGSTDFTARAVAPELAKRLGGSVVVENLGGAGGALGAAKAAAARADGYTLFLGHTNEVIVTGLVNTKQTFNAARDLTPIGLVASQPNVLVTTPRTGIKNTDEFLKSVRANPGKYSYGSSGIGTILHMTGELVKSQAGAFMVHIPYRGVAPLTSDLMGNNLEFGVFVLSSGLPHIKSGKMVPIGVSSQERSKAAPDIPALAEHPSLKGLDLSGWFGVFAPKGMPADVLARIRQAFDEAMQSPELRKQLEDSGATMIAKSGELPGFIQSETAKYQRIVKFANVKAE